MPVHKEGGGRKIKKIFGGSKNNDQLPGLKRGCWNAGNPNGGNPGNEVGGCQPFNAGKRPPTFGC